LKKEFSNIKLIIAGDGDLKNNYESYAAQNNLKASVEFRGKLQRQELLEAYQEANVFTLPTAIDSQPLVILEAMSAGLPIVSTRIGGIPNMIKDGEEGFLIEPHSPQILADKIAELFRDPQMRERFSGAARERAIKDFSWQRRMEKYNEILEKAIGE
jgi:glycosyltransferase involved in cell wall biosynthesis